MVVVGIAGGSGSGKSYVCDRIQDRLPSKTVIVPMDNYYKAFKDLSEFERMQINFDDPSTFDWELLKEHVEQLQAGKSVPMPDYSYEKSTRIGATETAPAEVIIIEGIYALYDEALNEKMDLRLFLSPDPDVRAVRRVRRDVEDRGRSVEFAVNQYLDKTKPMHEEKVAPTKEHADFVLDDREKNEFVEAVEKLIQRQRSRTNTSLKAFIEQEIR